MSDFQIKRARLNDYKAIKNIQKQGYGKVMWGFYTLLVGHIVLGYKEYVVYHKGDKVGFLHIKREGFKTRHIINICFLPECQQLGLGTQTMDWLKELNQKDSVERLTLHVRSRNKHVVNWYKKQGYIETGRIKCYYKDTKDDALKMTYTRNK